MENLRTKLVVVNENTLGYILPETPNKLCVYRAKVTCGKNSRFFSYNTEIFELYTTDVVRLSNKADFELYRCSFEGYETDTENYEFAN